MKPSAKVPPETKDKEDLEKRLVNDLLRDLGFVEKKEPNKSTNDVLRSFQTFLEKYRCENNLTRERVYTIGTELCNKVSRDYEVPSLAAKMREKLRLSYVPVAITSN
ncbi:hypothetical protein HY212_06555 [Candidatus Pacearchaeota archaeon]|nr:hypothetical protein [Candidatus Pacearchaeota archaeon]